jgi:hypothetical protein
MTRRKNKICYDLTSETPIVYAVFSLGMMFKIIFPLCVVAGCGLVVP